MPSVPTTLPAIYGSDALLKILSDEGDRSVYLLAISGAPRPWVVKLAPREVIAPRDASVLESEAESLGRMEAPTLAKILDFDESDSEIGIVMEHVHGKTVAAIAERAETGSLVLPPELGLVIAHDAFAAIAYFHAFEGTGRLHGNLSPRTVLVGYSGQAKVVGYRYGRHPRAEVSARVYEDFRPLANLLFDLPFERFPKALVEFVPHLLEEKLSPLEGAESVNEFLHGPGPSEDDRRVVAAWLDKFFPDDREIEIQENEHLLAEGCKLIAKSLVPRRGWTQIPAVGAEIGDYRIVKSLGEGCVGRVYEAEHRTTKARAALKVLHPRGRTDALEERFRRQVEPILRVANPHLVDIEHVGASADSRFLYLAMELLRGETLDQILAKGPPFPPLRALKIASQIAQALSAAHEAGVMHGNLKPSNVMLVKRKGNPELVKVMDLGLAQLDLGETILTRAGNRGDPLAYLAPEQAQGESATPTIDIYALGEVLYEMLGKKLPHEGDDILVSKTTVDPTPIERHRPDLPAELCQLVMKALARNPDHRFATVAELGQGIDALLAAPTTHPSGRPRVSLKIVAATAALGGLVAGGAILWSSERGDRALSDSRSHAPVVMAPAAEPVGLAAAESAVDATAAPLGAPMPLDAGLETGPPVAPPKPHPEESAAAAMPAPTPVEPPQAAPTVSPTEEARPARHKAEGASADQLLAAAEAAFDSGRRREAVKLGTRALKAGGSVRAHLALGGYYQSLHLFREALAQYKNALKLEPDNAVALRGAKIVERQLSGTR